MGLVETCAQGDVRVLAHHSARCAAHASLGQLLAAFAQSHGPVDACIVATAGYLGPDGELVSSNLPWPVSVSALQQALSLQQVHVINDFQALGYACAQINDHALLHLSGPAAVPRAPVLVIGPGTGFGAALWLPLADGATVLASEAGQSALAVRGPRQRAVLAQLEARFGHVSVEHALSGPGLLNLYQALCTLDGRAPEHTQPNAVSEAALGGADALATEALALFCELLGACAGDLAMTYGATGGVYLAGGILPQISRFLADSRFAAAFCNKGVMTPVLTQVPVKLVEHGQLGIIGAAHWYLQQLPTR